VLPIALFLLAAAAPVGKKAQEAKIKLSTHLDKTAIYVGDTVRYTVRAIHDPDIEFVLDSVKKENINLAPFVIRDLTARQGLFADHKRVTEITFEVATYESGSAEVRIPSFVLYYFIRKPGLEKSGDTLAESFTVPATRVGLRSTLTAEARRLRDVREIPSAGRERWIAAFALGSLGFAFLAVQAARRLWRSPAVERPAGPRPTRWRRARRWREFVRATKGIGRDTAEDQQRFYAEVSRFIREYLGESLEIDAAGMTPDELAAALERRGRNGLGAPVKNVLEKCEQVLYTPRGAELGRQWRDDVQADLARLGRGLRM
jgi:hypothetical protein